MYDLSGKVALVTGAGGERGFGRAIATRLAREGADVAVNDVAANPHGAGSGGWGGLDAVAREIEDGGRGALAVVADVSDARRSTRWWLRCWTGSGASTSW
ncbi:MAG: SDR family NAD(P)-dependent oxidoreductase [Chloroflexi bacterium]|nr:SDR family NAD(P)-dependent oxidoreductase [Chloroflexota bacterium]